MAAAALRTDRRGVDADWGRDVAAGAPEGASAAVSFGAGGRREARRRGGAGDALAQETLSVPPDEVGGANSRATTPMRESHRQRAL